MFLACWCRRACRRAPGDPWPVDDVKTTHELIAESPKVAQHGDSSTVTAQIYDLVEANTNGDTYRSDAVAWTFQTMHQTFPESGWFLTDFTAPDICHAYVDCGPQPSARPTPAPTGSTYPTVYLGCAQVDASGVVDKS